MKWVAVLFAKNTIVAVDCVLNGGELTGPEHRTYFVSTSVAKATVPRVNVSILEMTFSNGDKRSMQRGRMYHGPELVHERMRGPPLEYSGSRGRRGGWSERPRQGMME
jgi:hypothetical protein